MKKLFLLALLALMGVAGVSAQTAADKIVGVYKAVQGNDVSRVRISKVAGGYRAQIIWLQNPKNEDGTPRTDKRNPDKAKRSVHSDRIVLVDKMTYRDGAWGDAKIYDPTMGKSFKVKMWFKDSKTLIVQGSLLVFSKKMQWTRIE